MNNNTRYLMHEGSIELPAGFQDRTANIFLATDPKQTPLNLNIARDTLEPEETLNTYVDRQIRLLQKNMRGFTLKTRHAVSLGRAPTNLAGECIESTRKEGGQVIYQRQAAFLCGPRRALIFSATASKPFVDEIHALWLRWLESYQPAKA